MQPLSIWEMFWQLGLGVLIATPVILCVGIVVYLMFKPLEWVDKLGD
jgi:hypothetical protein